MKKATRKQTKTHNAQLVLKTIYQQQGLSRADLARATHLTRPTVSTIVGELIDNGLVQEIGQGESQGGKPPILLDVVQDSQQIIGIDLGNSEFRGAIFNLRGKKTRQVKLPTGGAVGGDALELVYKLIDELLLKGDGPILGIGVGTPGITDTNQGIIYEAVNLGWSDLALRSLLAERYQVAVHIANDSQAAALGELSFGQGDKVSNLVVIKAGIGISAGIVLNGRVFSGDHASQGEIGHVTVVEGGKRCTCGRLGCLETVASSRAIIEGGRRIAENEPDSIIGRLAAANETITTDVVLHAFEAGDEQVREMIAGVGQHLGSAVAHIVSLLDIQHLFICGRTARFGDPLLAAIGEEMQRRVLKRIADNTTIAISDLGDDIIILGAAALVLSHELGVI